MTTPGDRVRMVRTQLRMTGATFTAHLNKVALQLGFEAYWDEPKLNKTERNHREIQPVDLAILTAVDPKGRGWFWLAFGRREPRVARPRQASGAKPLHLRRPRR